MKQISKQEITLSAAALAIGALTAASARSDGDLAPLRREVGCGAALCILLWVAMNHASQRRHRETNGEILVRLTGVDHKVDHVIAADTKVASAVRNLFELADETEDAGPLPPLRSCS